LALVLLSFLARPVHADWDAGRFPEGDNAWTLPQWHLRLNILGRSAIGLTDRLELSTYLPLDLALFPNFGLKYRFLDTGRWGSALELNAAGGIYPIPVASAFPLPGGILGGAGIVFLFGAFQGATLHVSSQVADTVSVSARGSVFAVEAAGAFIGGIAGAGNGGAAVLPLGLALGTSASGASGGVEADWVIGAHDSLFAEADLYGLRGHHTLMLWPFGGWVHAWPYVHLMVGVYTFRDLPLLPGEKPPKLPVSPFANVYWNFTL
jgi:hypothetical protein